MKETIGDMGFRCTEKSASRDFALSCDRLQTNEREGFFFSCVLLDERTRVGILICKNRSIELRRCPRPLAHCSHAIYSSYLSVRGLANTQRRFFFFFSFLRATLDDKHIVYTFFFLHRRFFWSNKRTSRREREVEL